MEAEAVGEEVDAPLVGKETEEVQWAAVWIDGGQQAEAIQVESFVVFQCVVSSRSRVRPRLAVAVCCGCIALLATQT